MNFILWVGVIVLFVQVRSLAARVRSVEDTLYKKDVAPTVVAPTILNSTEDHGAVVASVASHAVVGVAEAVAPSFTPVAVTLEQNVVRSTTAPLTTPPPSEFFLYTWFKEQTLIKIGAVLFFLGALWFVSYAINEGWISETLRIVLGLGVGIVFYIAAVWRSKTDQDQYLIITTLGTAIIVATIYAGQMLFLVFPPALALCLIVLSLTYTVSVSVRAHVEWLAVVAAVAGLLAPFMINSATPDLGGLMVYLLGLSVGLLTVVFFTNWRTVSFVLVVGVSMLQIQALNTAPVVALWWYGVVFALIFLASSTTSLVRSRTPEAIDVATLGIAGLLYTVLANAGAGMPGLALCIAALILAVIGYAVHVQDAAPRIVAVFACFAGAAWMIGTVLLFDGYSESIALTVEVALAFATLTYLNLSERAVYLSLATFTIPLVSALSVLYSPLWSEGIWHRDALAAFCTVVALVGSTLWLTEQERFRFKSWFVIASSTLGVASLVYTLLFLAQIGHVYGNGGYVLVYVLWGGFIAVCAYYSLMSTLPLSWLRTCGTTLVLPIFLSITSLDPALWTAGVVHPDAIGLYIMAALAAELLGLSVVRYRRTEQIVYKKWAIGFLVGTLAYVFAILAVFWPGLLGQGSIGVDVVLYVSYALITYALVTVFWHLRNPIPAVYYGLSVGIIPVLMSLVSIDSPLWDESVLQPAAAGLYAMTALVFLLAMKRSMANTMRSTTVKNVATGLYILGSMYGVALVWLMAHTLSATADIAVTVALFVYTLAGLGLYVLGSSRTDKTVKYAGMTLLVLVVLRLGIVEVWNMDMIWRIVTFLGIGLLFMLAALLEKKPNK